jgi:hypothetical protein
MEDWQELAAQLRVDSIRCTTEAGSGHPTSCLSAADLMAVLLAKYLKYEVHPSKAYLASWMARILSLKNCWSRNPYACRFIVLILLFVPSRGPVLIGYS